MNGIVLVNYKILVHFCSDKGIADYTLTDISTH
jgi:hypothetical protein